MTVTACGSVAVFFYLVVPWTYGRCHRVTLKVSTIRKRAVVMSFDDGPGSRLTLPIIETLKEFDVKGTFFLLGRNIAGREAIVKRIATEGHEICSHGFDHLHAWKVWPWKSIRDVQKGWQEIDRVLGVRRGTYPYRPPHGELNVVVLLYLIYKRVPILYWTLDSRDTWAWKKGAPSIESFSKQMIRGGVLLMHDFDRATDNRDQYVMDTVELAINVIRSNNLKICTLSQLRDFSP